MSNGVRSACVIGWPVAHSRSPLIHNYWLKQHGLQGEYRREAVSPEQLTDFVKTLGQRGYVGANVTLPHKEAMLALSKPDERARAVGAANTLWFDDNGKLRSTNTDVEGFIDNLKVVAPSWARGLETAVVLGAGGAACAIVHGLLLNGAETVHVVNRSFDRAEALCKRLGKGLHPVRWGERNALLARAGLLVNTTTLGMHGQPEVEVDVNRLPASAVVADLVYVPLETSLVRRARERGLRTADGLGMLLHQAVRGFHLWFGVRPQVTPELRKLIEDDLRKTDQPPAPAQE
jgi:shikimate dehydrogenase